MKRHRRLMLKVNVEAIAFEGANPRHEHEWHIGAAITSLDISILVK